MPCYSKIVTVLIDLPTIEKVAASLGILCARHTAHRYTLSKDGDSVVIERGREGEKFYASSGVGNYPDNILTPLVMGYAKERVKAQMAKKGYTMSAGTKAGEFVLTSYK